MKRTQYLALVAIALLGVSYWLRRPPRNNMSEGNLTQMESRLVVAPNVDDALALSGVPSAAGTSQETPRLSNEQEAKLAAAKKRLPSAPEESLRNLMRQGIDLDGIERGRSKVFVEVQNLKYAIRLYKAAYGDLPKGENAEIAKALLGGNPRGETIMYWPPKQLGPSGEFLDPWGTPYSIRIIDQTLEIRSAGRDLRFSTEDDEVTTLDAK